MAIFLAIGLNRDPSEIPSPLINKTAPQFNAPQLENPAQFLSNNDLLGKVWLLNVWASWCGSCREEHPVLNLLAQQPNVLLVGLNYKDKAPDALAWLQQGGNPYSVSIMDSNGRIGIDWGVYGVPETFIIDKKGNVRSKHIGALTEQAMQQTLLPLINQLQAE
jgi:cytochrome c biogenesis protein CcmG/thiol:disulfide interchange protein DsbE